jgi:hypothetical protein
MAVALLCGVADLAVCRLALGKPAFGCFRRYPTRDPYLLAVYVNEGLARSNADSLSSGIASEAANQYQLNAGL